MPSRKTLTVVASFVAAGLLALAVGYAEYRTNVVARTLGSYLADVNATRPSTGRLWDLISSEREARSVLPDSAVSLPAPSDIPPLVRAHRLTVERIPADGPPGYLAVLAETVADPDIPDAARLVSGVRVYRVGRRLLEAATFDTAPYLAEARAEAERMAAALDDAAPDEDGPIDPPVTESLPDTSTQAADTLQILPADTIAASVVETFTAVLLEDRAARVKAAALADWDAGRIQQVFLNRDLVDYRGELHLADPAAAALGFRVPAPAVNAALGLPVEQAP